MIILPVPPSRPCIRMRARLALVPGLSDSYLSRIALTAGVMLIARDAPLLPIRFGFGRPRVAAARAIQIGGGAAPDGPPQSSLIGSLPLRFTTLPRECGGFDMIGLIALLNVS